MSKVILAFTRLARLIFTNRCESTVRIVVRRERGARQRRGQSVSPVPLTKGGSRAERMAAYQGRQNGTPNNAQERSVSKSTGIASTRPLNARNTSTEPSIDDLLPIDGLIPKGFDPQCVKAVIYWGFLRPGHRAPLLNDNYGEREGVIRFVTGKGYPHDQVVIIIRMLERHELVQTHVHQGRDCISLIIKTERLSSHGSREIARACKTALYRMKVLQR